MIYFYTCKESLIIFHSGAVYTSCRKCMWGEREGFSGRCISWKRRIGQKVILTLK